MTSATLAAVKDTADRAVGSEQFAFALVNILEDFSDEKDRLHQTQIAVLNVLEDAASEREQLERMQHAIINILDDLYEEKRHLEAAQTELVRKSEELGGSLRDKEMLLREVHHRVKNNLQVIASLLSLQSGYVHDAEMLAKFEESQGRIRSMALLHEKLYGSDSIARVDLAEYVRSLVDILLRTYATNRAVRPDLHLEPVAVTIDTALPVGLLLNELVTNSLKYAFADGRRGSVRVKLERACDGEIAMNVADDGIGMKQDFDIARVSTLGLRLVRMFAKQLGAALSVRSGEAGTEFDLRFCEVAGAR